ncbi:MAG: DUF2892 domain-containing protein [Gemmatimonadetes bacterium]|nr:DUF2892 domain-containing protein [Gemmatimonadota bacterium]
MEVDAADGPAPRPANVAPIERWASVSGGAALALYGLLRRDLAGLGLALAGGALIERGATGHCRVYGALGLGTAEETRSPVASVPHNTGVKVERSVTVARAPRELYAFWRQFENLPRFMDHLESVTDLGEGRSRWVAKAPLGRTVGWDAEIHNELPNELIAWRSLPGSEVDNAGSVQFRELPEGRGSVVRVVLEYRPPAGKAGAVLARLLGEDPEKQVREDLRRFKQVMEAGEVPTTEGQPSGRSQWSVRPGDDR